MKTFLSSLLLILGMSTAMQSMTPPSRQISKDAQAKHGGIINRAVRPFIPRLRLVNEVKTNIPIQPTVLFHVLSANSNQEENRDQDEQYSIYEAPEPVRKFAQDIIQDPSIVISATNNLEEPIFAGMTSKEVSFIAYSEDFVGTILESAAGKPRTRLTINQFSKIVSDKNLNEEDAFELFKRTSCDKEVGVGTIHEHAHIIKNHTDQNAILDEKLTNNEISPRTYFAENRRMEEEADDRIYQRGSPRTQMAAENFFGKLCVLELRSGDFDDTYSTHPSSCERADKATAAVMRIIGPINGGN